MLTILNRVPVVIIRKHRLNIKVDGRRQGNYRTLGDVGHSVMEYVTNNSK